MDNCFQIISKIEKLNAIRISGSIAMVQYNKESRSVPSKRFSITMGRLLLHTVVILLVSTISVTSGKLFEAPSKYTGRIEVLLDIDFTLHLKAKKDGKKVCTKKLTDHDVDMVRLLETSSRNLFTLELVFTEPNGESCALAYRFLRYDSPDIVGLSKEVYFTPAMAFDQVDSSIEQVKFDEPGHRQENIGNYKKSYLCNRTEVVSFKKSSQENDDYHYCVKLETRHFHVQAFVVRDGGFSPEPPTVCEDPSESGELAIVIGTAVGSIFLLVVVAVIMCLLVRQKRQQPYINFERGLN